MIWKIQLHFNVLVILSHCTLLLPRQAANMRIHRCREK